MAVDPWDQELQPPGRINWLIGVLDHDLTNNDLTMPADELAARYVEDCGWLLEENRALRRALLDVEVLAADAERDAYAARSLAQMARTNDPVPAVPIGGEGR